MGSVYQNDYHCDFDLVKSWWKDFTLSDVDITLHTPDDCDPMLVDWTDESRLKNTTWVIRLKIHPNPPMLFGFVPSKRPLENLKWEASVQWYPLPCYKPVALALQEKLMKRGAKSIGKAISSY